MTEEAALSAFVAGRISFSALRNAVQESTQFRFEPNGAIRITATRRLPRTIVRPADVRRALVRYRDGEVTVEELAVWGLVIYNLQAFELRASSASAAEATWNVLGELSLAAINDAFTAERVSQLLAELEESEDVTTRSANDG